MPWILSILILLVGFTIRLEIGLGRQAEIEEQRAYINKITEGMIDTLTIQSEETRTLAKKYMKVNSKLSYDSALDMALGTYGAARLFDLQPELIAAVIKAESSARPEAVSSCGARGLMQVAPRFWDDELKSRGLIVNADDYHDTFQGIYAGAYVLAKCLDTRDGDLEAALTYYSGGAKNYYDKVIGIMPEFK